MIRRNGLILIFAFSLVISFLAGPANTEPINRTETKPSFAFSSEELIFEGEFSKAIFRGLDVADMSFKSSQDGERLNLSIEVTSKGFAPKLFGLKFHQLIESVVDPSPFQPIKTNKLDEQGKRVRKSETLFDKASSKIVWAEVDPTQSNKQLNTVTIPFNGVAQDLASVFYFVRTQPLKVGQSFTVPLHDSGRVFNVSVKVVERKQIKTAIGKTWAVRVVPDVFGEGKLIEGEGSISIWHTEDVRRIPVRIQIKNKLGTIEFKLKKMNTKASKD